MKKENNITSFLVPIILVLLLCSCKNETQQRKEDVNDVNPKQTYKTIGYIERIHPEFDAIIPKDAKIEVLSDTLEWAEGPLWIPSKKWVLCSDVKENKIWKWTETNGMELYLNNSGFDGNDTDSRERGSNGLTLDLDGNLIICQHGNRQVVQLNESLENQNNNFKVLVSHFDGKRLNSPNDLVYDSRGNLYFTDPPYGLSEAMMDDPNKELDFQGVYRFSKDGNLKLLTSSISRPNGLAFNPDETKLYVANTDANNAQWLSFSVTENGELGESEEILNVTQLIGKEIGFPDGIKVDAQGNIFTAGPGGLWIFNADFELLGKIKPDEWVSNCAFDDNFSTLYITADNTLLRVKLK